MEQYYLKQKKILLVDDEKEILDMITDFLSRDGYTQIRTAGTVKDALRTAEEWGAELAVLDVMLPDGDGFSLFERMRGFTEIPVLFLTARGEDEDRIRGLGLGADDYMVKPFLPKELLLRIGIILRRYYKAEDPAVELQDRSCPGRGGQKRRTSAPDCERTRDPVSIVPECGADRDH